MSEAQHHVNERRGIHIDDKIAGFGLNSRSHMFPPQEGANEDCERIVAELGKEFFNA
ncbi:MAG: hypothetical protein WDM89_05640 [Rhizomicrobium sp.]